MLLRANGPDPRDSGVVAVVVAICAVVIFGASALAVDITNAYTRRRAVQTTADLAALAGAQSLPSTCAAWTEAVAYLRSNPVREDGGAGDFSDVTDGVLRDGDLANGEVQVQDNAGTALAGVCSPGSSAGRRVRVVTPTRSVAFGLANAIGFHNVRVGASATAGIFTGGSMLPIFIPEPCQSGSQVIKDGSGASVQPVYSPAGNNNGPWVDSVSPFVGASGSTPVLTIELKNIANPATANVTNMAISFTMGTVSVPASAAPLLRPATYLATGSHTARITVTLPSAVSAVSGVWHLRVAQTIGATLIWSPDQKTGQYQVIPAFCGQEATGDFGLLDSPRSDTIQSQLALDKNIANGVDHPLDPFPVQPPPVDPTRADNCRTHPANAPISQGVLDNAGNLAAGVTPNCLDVNTGNKVDALTDGLVMGGSGFTGRLTRTPAKVCPAPAGGSNPATLLGRSIVNSALSCYLRPGRTLADLNNIGVVTSAGTDGLLLPEIASDPRFFVIPVIAAKTNPQNGFYPIVRFRAAFITDETELTAATPANGLRSSASKVTEMRAFLFDIEALPDVVKTGGNGITFNGTLKIVRLIQ